MRAFLLVALQVSFGVGFNPKECLDLLTECGRHLNDTIPTLVPPNYGGYSGDECYYCAQTMKYVPQLAQTFCISEGIPDNYVDTLTSLVCDIFNDDPDCVSTVTDVAVFAWSQWRRKGHCDPCACLSDALTELIPVLKLMKPYCESCDGVLSWLGIPWCPRPVDFCTICDNAGCPPATSCLAHAPLC